MMKPHWYFITCYHCPVCGGTTTYRERMYTPRPEAWEDRNREYVDNSCAQRDVSGV